ncbi:MAG: hypothetical protein Fur0039_07230 [Rhodocyclaceae bacterium]
MLRALAAAWPEAHIAFAGHPKRIETLRHLPFVTRLQAITKTVAPWLAHLPGPAFDLALVFGHDAPLVRYALRRARRVVAFRQPHAALNARLHAIAGQDGYSPRHAVTHLLQAIRPLGIPPAGMHLSYRVTDAEDAWARRLLASMPDRGHPLVGLQVASFPTKGFRDWPLAHFEALCGRILDAHPQAHFLIFGGMLEAARTARLQRRLASRASLFAGRLSLRQTAALMNRIDLYVGVDTGPTHIMGALHRPMVALYHPTSPSRALAPLEHPCCHVVDHPLADRGATPDTPMAEITVDMVWEKVRAALSGHFPPPLTTPWE